MCELRDWDLDNLDRHGYFSVHRCPPTSCRYLHDTIPFQMLVMLIQSQGRL